MKLISVKEASKLLNVNEQTIRNYIKEKKIRSFESEQGLTLVEKKECLKLKPCVITVFNQKGGVSKTSSSIVFSDYFESKEYKILLVDLDQQANLSKAFFNYEDLKNSYSLYDYIESKITLQKIIKPFNENVHLLPASIKLATKDVLDTTMALKYKDDFYEVFKKYNIIIIDCPPSLNFFSRLGVTLANYLFIPIIPEPFCLDGLTDAFETIKMVLPLNKDFINYRIFVTKYEARKTIIKEQNLAILKEDYKSILMTNYLPNFVSIIERSITRENLFSSNNKKNSLLLNLGEEVEEEIYENRPIL